MKLKSKPVKIEQQKEQQEIEESEKGKKFQPHFNFLCSNSSRKVFELREKLGEFVRPSPESPRTNGCKARKKFLFDCEI